MEYSKIFTNSSILVKGLTNLLEDNAITYIIKDRFESSRLAGFGESAAAVEVHVLATDLEKAIPLVQQYEAEINA